MSEKFDLSLVATPYVIRAVKVIVRAERDAQGMSARQSQDPRGLGPEAASPVANGDAPE